MTQPLPASVEQVVVPRTSDLGGFEVARALPTRARRAVGPFVFLDQIGPSTLPAGNGIDVRPHPHIGLATVTYLFEGEIMHRDSLGCVQATRCARVAARSPACRHGSRCPANTRRPRPPSSTTTTPRCR
jgi:redox-sensitive bicupin YhaK (pirin superfamily)